MSGVMAGQGLAPLKTIPFDDAPLTPRRLPG